MSRVLLLLDQKENQELLGAELDGDYDVRVGDSDSDLHERFDILILDGRALDRLWKQVQERKTEEQPLFLPVLLVTSRPNVKMITRHLWRSVDELIITPIEKPELRARIQILLRARQLSLELQERAGAAEESARMRDEVMAMVSHDLRNPLNIVLSNASILLETATSLEAKERSQLQAIHRAVGQMSRLTQDLLDISDLESGQVRVQPRKESAESLVRGACSQHARSAETRSITLRYEAADNLPAVRADQDRIDQLFGNLIGNALKFTPAGGTVVVRAASVDGRVRFSVSDDGPGLTEEERERVFDRFWQGRHSDAPGAGLGLAIARGIAEAHGGRIGVESQPGDGSEFWFELPVDDQSGD